MNINEYWKKYLKDTNQSEYEAVFSGEIVFESSGLVGFEQRNLILNGKKTATFTPFDCFEINFEPIPVVGEVYIVEDENDNPYGIIEIDDVKILPFKDISWEMAKQDGEDQNFAQWLEKQRLFMQEEAEICGFDFTDDSKVVFEHFHLIYK